MRPWCGREFRVDISECRDRRSARPACGATRWPDPRPSTTGRRGSRSRTCRTWRVLAHEYDWRGRTTDERHPQFTHAIDDLDIHFVHARSPEPGRGAARHHPRLARLGRRVLRGARPADRSGRHGGDAADAFHVVSRRCRATGSATSRPRPGGASRGSPRRGRADEPARLRALRRAGRRLGLGGRPPPSATDRTRPARSAST